MEQLWWLRLNVMTKQLCLRNLFTSNILIFMTLIHIYVRKQRIHYNASKLKQRV